MDRRRLSALVLCLDCGAPVGVRPGELTALCARCRVYARLGRTRPAARVKIIRAEIEAVPCVRCGSRAPAGREVCWPCLCAERRGTDSRHGRAAYWRPLVLAESRQWEAHVDEPLTALAAALERAGA